MHRRQDLPLEHELLRLVRQVQHYVYSPVLRELPDTHCGRHDELPLR